MAEVLWSLPKADFCSSFNEAQCRNSHHSVILCYCSWRMPSCFISPWTNLRHRQFNYTGPVTAASYLSSTKFVDALLLACSTFTWGSLQPCLSKLIETGVGWDVESCVQLLYRLVTLQPSLNSEQQALGQELAVPICKVLGEEDLVSTYCIWQRGVRSQDFVCSLLKTLSLLDCTTQLEAFC